MMMRDDRLDVDVVNQNRWRAKKFVSHLVDVLIFLIISVLIQLNSDHIPYNKGIPMPLYLYIYMEEFRTHIHVFILALYVYI